MCICKNLHWNLSITRQPQTYRNFIVLLWLLTRCEVDLWSLPNYNSNLYCIIYIRGQTQNALIFVQPLKDESKKYTGSCVYHNTQETAGLHRSNRKGFSLIITQSFRSTIVSNQQLIASVFHFSLSLSLSAN